MKIPIFILMYSDLYKGEEMVTWSFSSNYITDILFEISTEIYRDFTGEFYLKDAVLSDIKPTVF